MQIDPYQTWFTKKLLFFFFGTFSQLTFTSNTTTTRNLLENGNSFFHPPKTRVSILNSLQENLTIHCKSKDDDLGTHVIGFNQTYEWKFEINFWQTTLFFCKFDLHGISATFDVFKAQRDYDDRCRVLCSWVAREDGLYGYITLNKLKKKTWMT